MNKLRNLLIPVSGLCALLLVACGPGDKETPTATTGPKPTTPPGVTATIAPSPTSPAATATTLGGVLDKASDPAPYELNNIKYGGTFNWQWGFSNGYLEPKQITQLNDLYPAAQKPVMWVANQKDQFAHLAPMLAEKWSTSADLKTYTLNLRKGIKWHNIAPVNGREFVADDILFNIKRYSEKDSIRAPFYSQIVLAEAPDKYTVVLRLKNPSAWLLNDIWGGTEWLVPQELVAETNGVMATKFIGTGPYMLKDYKFRQGALYVRNPDSWMKDTNGNPLPYTDAIHMIYMTDTGTTTAAFRTAQIDYGPSYATSGSIPASEALAKSVPGMKVYALGAQQPRMLSFNINKAPWSDVRVRRAFNMLIDKNKFADAIFETGTWEYSTPLQWSNVSDQPFKLTDLGQYAQYNPTEAKKLLIEAGFADGKMKVAGPVEYAIGGGTTSHLNFGQNLQQLYKQNGVEIELKGLDPTTYYSKWYLHNYDDLSLSFVNTGDYSVNWYAQNKFLKDATQNTSMIADPEVQKAVAEIKGVTDPAKLRVLAKSLWDFDTQGSYNVYVPVQKAFMFASPRTRSFTVRRGPSFTAMEMWMWLADAPRTAP
ncbi:MAG: ABC transporter substrate-binding protein [Dehalococcoidia bacterium]|nr:ABC transporter substrate-binding protein [Dehalococcoidia bacterium]